MTTSATPVVLIAGMNLSDRLWSRCELPPGTVLVTLQDDSVDAAVGRLLDELPPRFILGGLSLGGIVAMHLVARAPDRVAGLMLMATNARSPTAEQLEGWAATIEELAGARHRSAGTGPREYQESILPLLLSDPGVDDWAAVVTDSAADLTTDTLINQLTLQQSRTDARPGLRRCHAPTVILAGDRDALCPVSNHEEIRDALPEVTSVSLTVLHGVGHLIPVEAPGAVASALDTLLHHTQTTLDQPTMNQTTLERPCTTP
ncbi:alpha/beta hydrolase [Corynebacterium sp. USCH3]|uniref:alpha/beta fold hydrolase n=1 Tax=Corynebacterium sp. USCH3 TaxID=3024840 RepID=UPI0030B5CB63